MGGVLPVSPITHIQVVRLGLATYRLIGYTANGHAWDFEGWWWTRRSATRAARR